MRALVLPVLLLAGLAQAAAAQTAFEDPDFGVHMEIPVGMREITAEERARIDGIPVEQARNVPRGEAPDGKVQHTWVWVDSGPYNRQISLHLYDAAPPYRTPAQLREVHEREGMVVEAEDILPPPLNAARLEGTFLRQPDNAPMRRLVIYVPDVARNRFALLSLQAFAGDWEIVKPELSRVVQSLRLEGVKTGGGGEPRPGAMMGQPPRPGAPGAVPGAGTANADDDWGRLEVAGSLVLAVLLIGSLFLGGRAAS